MAQWGKVLAAKLMTWAWFLGPQGGGENGGLQVILCALQAFCAAYSVRIYFPLCLIAATEADTPCMSSTKGMLLFHVKNQYILLWTRNPHDPCKPEARPHSALRQGSCSPSGRGSTVPTQPGLAGAGGAEWHMAKAGLLKISDQPGVQWGQHKLGLPSKTTSQDSSTKPPRGGAVCLKVPSSESRTEACGISVAAVTWHYDPHPLARAKTFLCSAWVALWPLFLASPRAFWS